MAAVPLTEDEVNTIILDVRRKLSRAVLVLKVKWAHVSDPALQDTWTGRPRVVRGALVIKYEEDAETYTFPHLESTVYYDISVSEEKPRMAAAVVNEKEEPVEFAHYKPATWYEYIEGGSERDIDILEQKLRNSDFAVHAGSSQKRKDAFDALMLWCRVCRETEDWHKKDSKLLGLGEHLVRSLRDVVESERGRNVVAIRNELEPLLKPDDLYGAAAKKVSASSAQKTSHKTSERKCYTCAQKGHIAKDCPEKKQDFRKGGTGSAMDGKKTN